MDNRIRLLREEANLRQVDVAEATGIDQKTLSNYETGKTNPDSFALKSLADFFNVSIDYLIGRTDFNIHSKKDIINKIDSIINDLEIIRNKL